MLGEDRWWWASEFKLSIAYRTSTKIPIRESAIFSDWFFLCRLPFQCGVIGNCVFSVETRDRHKGNKNHSSHPTSISITVFFLMKRSETRNRHYPVRLLNTFTDREISCTLWKSQRCVEHDNLHNLPTNRFRDYFEKKNMKSERVASNRYR